MNTKQIISKLFATVAIVGVFVAVCTADESANEIACRLIGTATFIGGLIGWSLLTDTEAV